MIIPFPPKACRYYLRGVCCRMEAQNPGLHRELGCILLQRLMECWDYWVDKSDDLGFSLSPTNFMQECLVVRLHDAPSGCPFRHSVEPFAFLAAEDITDCDHLMHNACLLVMPPCEKRCEHYAPARSPIPDARRWFFDALGRK
jgi:hypothetical protein